MTSAKQILVAPISARDATALVRRVHYSHNSTQNSQLHFGVFLNGELHGAMQFGPSLDKRKIQHLVKDTPWNGFLELNRMAFDEHLPRNSESRALAVAFRIIRKQYPHVQWVVSFADGTQCGDGTIYRAAGFILTSIKKNTSIWESGDGQDWSTKVKERAGDNKLSVTKDRALTNISMREAAHGELNGSASMARFVAAGFRPKRGFQLRYIYFLDPTARERLTVPELPFSAIEEQGAGMYLGHARGKQAIDQAPPDQRRGSGDPHAPPTTKKGRREASPLSPRKAS